MKPYLLLTPGPLTTSETVKETMMTDWCTWDEDYNLGIVQELRKDLVSIATKNIKDYTSVLLQGSGTYCVEAVLGATITPKDKLLICSTETAWVILPNIITSIMICSLLKKQSRYLWNM